MRCGYFKQKPRGGICDTKPMDNIIVRPLSDNRAGCEERICGMGAKAAAGGICLKYPLGADTSAYHFMDNIRVRPLSDKSGRGRTII